MALLHDDLADWRALMAAQVALTSSQETAVLRQRSDWQSAQSVLEVGVGTGDFLAALVQAFPTKDYRGLELDSGYLEYAKELQRGGALGRAELLLGDFYQSSQTYDAVMCRMFVQHQSNPRDFCLRASNACKIGGSIYLIDPQDACRHAFPRIDLFDEFFEKLRLEQRKNGLNGVTDAELEGLFGAQQLSVVENKILTINIQSAKYKRTFFDVIRLSSRLAAKLYNFEFDHERFQASLARWYAAPDGHAQLAERLMVLRRGNSGAL
jgi:SAM-dependent methyltransferase